MNLNLFLTGCSVSGQIIQGDKISVCKGTWSGHIRNATHLCAPGWGVCSHKEQHLLSMVQWQQATAIRGCYAINAAQDGGRCRECSNTMDTVSFIQNMGMLSKILYSSACLCMYL